MALVRDETSTGYNWPVGKGAGRNGRAEKLWRVGKSEEMGFQTRKKLITRKREGSARVGRSRADTVMEWCVSGAKDLRFTGREFHERREELRND